MMKRFSENSERLNSLLLTIFAKSSIDEYIQLLFLFVTFDILLTVACNIYDVHIILTVNGSVSFFSAIGKDPLKGTSIISTTLTPSVPFPTELFGT